MTRVLLALAILLPACVRDRYGELVTRYQLREEAWAAPCRNYCAAVTHVPPHAVGLVIRSKANVCACAVPHDAVLDMMEQAQHAGAFDGFLRVKLPEPVGLWSDDPVEQLHALEGMAMKTLEEARKCARKRP